MIRAAFFDIDGTLLPFGAQSLPRSARESLDAMRANGIKLFVATGRCEAGLNSAMERINYEFDGYVTLNGQYCFTPTERIRAFPIPQSDVKGLLMYHELYPERIVCVDEVEFRHYNVQYPGSDAYRIEGEHRPLSETLRRMIETNTPIYQVSATLPSDDDAEFIAHMPGCKAERWHPDHVDIIPAVGGKNVGIEAMLSHFGITFADTIAFGDGGNDISMIKAAGIGVAMGNAPEAVKKNADYITSSAEDDGIYRAAEHFSLL